MKSRICQFLVKEQRPYYYSFNCNCNCMLNLFLIALPGYSTYTHIPWFSDSIIHISFSSLKLPTFFFLLCFLDLHSCHSQNSSIGYLIFLSVWSMGRVSLPPPVCDTNLSQRLSFENNNNNNNHLREASFSSYLNHAEKEFVRKLAEAARDRPQEEDGDIEVFGAEKYFNGGMDNPNPLKLRPRRQQFKKAEQMNVHQKKPKTKISRSGTPSIRSESSWNSQNTLLQRRNHSGPGESKKKNKSSLKPKGFLYKCCGCHKDSVEEVHSSNNTKTNPKQELVRSGLNFTFRKSTSKLAEPKNLPLKMKIQVEEQQARRSIEVFGSSLKAQSVETVSLNHLERKLSMLSWNDIGPRVKESDSNMSVSATDDSILIDNGDAESDASSDLFEIESLMGNPNPFLVRQGSDCTDCVTPTTCYAPSEASIEWSVVTASATDYDERRLSTTSPTAAAEEIQRRRSNLLMGCRSKKAAGDAYGSEAEVCRRAEAFGRMTRFEAETKVMGFVGTNSISRRYSPQMSNILYV
ncbi:protein PHYTOCHROME KINASE SUBSTRATE 1-like [Momordica charantia]|uniref:Protein PHYTOCHROME KINASE SUBSTRATE 1-like n=1 Tax=Momordica charantia TaxID=3673 RepID=A0A6J1DB72_MOMCH|nr:protein PHYTOCHROME KINASE SUBSTRATE 1-like [Momordica charantia]